MRVIDYWQFVTVWYKGCECDDFPYQPLLHGI